MSGFAVVAGLAVDGGLTLPLPAEDRGEVEGAAVWTLAGATGAEADGDTASSVGTGDPTLTLAGGVGSAGWVGGGIAMLPPDGDLFPCSPGPPRSANAAATPPIASTAISTATSAPVLPGPAALRDPASAVWVVGPCANEAAARELTGPW
jgi:hypothetical protein